MLDYSAIFSSIDRGDWAAFGSFLTDDVTFRYGSQPVVHGKAAVLAASEAAVAPFTKVQHHYDTDWASTSDCVVAGDVSYTLPSNETIRLPFLNRFKLEDGKIREYLIFIDASPVFAALQGAA